MSPRRRRGFTLLELVIVVVCITILVSAGGFTINTITQAQRSRTISDATHLYNALIGTKDFNGFFGDVGYLPPVSEAATSLVAVKPAAAPMQQIVRGTTVGWRGPYTGFDVSAVASDPWGMPWSMDAGLATRGRISSMGADKIPGTLDDVVVPAVVSRTAFANNGKGDVVVFVVVPETNVYLDGNDATVRVTDPLAPISTWPWLTVTEQPTLPDAKFTARNLVAGRHLVTVDGSGLYLGRVGYGSVYVSGGTQATITVRLGYQ